MASHGVALGASPSHLRLQVARPHALRSARSGVAFTRPRPVVLAAKKADVKAAAAPAPAVPPPGSAPLPAAPAPADTSIYAMPMPGEEAPIAPMAPLYPPQYYQGAPYQGAYPGYYPPPSPPPKKEGLPAAVWVGIGVVIAVGAGKLMDGMKSKQQDIQQAMMQQMLKSMMGGAAPPGGASPFGAPGANPFGAPGASPFGAPGASPFGARPGPTAASSAARAPAVDVTAKPVTPTPAEPPKAAAAPAAAAAAAAAPAEPSVSTSGSAASSSTAGASSSSSSSYFQDAEVVDDPKTAGGGGKGMFSIDMLERMMKDPNMQKMIYPYLPEGMRTPETFEWMMKNPAYRQQLETMLTQGGAGMDTRMAEMLKDFDINSPEVQQQFDAMGMKPEDMISKIMSNPELTMAFQSPKVQAAIMDCSQNPMNITKYQDDKEVMEVFQKISELFPAGPGGMPNAMGGMPGGGFPGGGFPPAGR